jgi:acyl-CoA thioester hydrolase
MAAKGELRPLVSPAREGTVRIRVRYCECDPAGVAHHASYVPWLEIARTELLRGTGVTYAAMEREGVLLVVAALTVTYRRPVYYDDVVEVRTRVTGGSRVKIEHAYEIVIAEDGGHGKRAGGGSGEVVTRAGTTLVCVDREGRVRGLPEWLVDPGISPNTR